MLDILIAIVPKINPDAPTVGPALLKTHIQDAGFTCEVIDLNIKLFNAAKAKNKEHLWKYDDHFFSTDHSDPYLSKDFNKFYKEFKDVFNEWINIIREKNPKYLGLSLLSIYSQSVAIKIGQLVKKNLPHIKIVWGGPQIEHGVDTFKDLGYLDHYISGDAEISIVEFLKDNLTYKGIDSLEVNQLLDLNSMKFPNYDDMIWDEYYDPSNHRPTYITGSRGCVKRCTFCNVYKIWPEFRFRSGENIAKEIIYIKERYDRSIFKFTDSLINGSMKAFRNLCLVLSEYRKINTDIKLGWISQWIIRSKHQSPESDYIAMKESGCIMLEIGLESFSQDVRWHMGKKFTDEDMWWCLDMLNKQEIPHVLLMIVGYPTETEEDHQHTLQCVKKIFNLGWDKYTNFSFGNTLMLTTPQPLYKLVKDELEYFNSNIDWKYRDNDLETRVRRFKEVNDLVKNLSKIKRIPQMTDKALKNYEKKLQGKLPNDRWDG